jgi:hypothetical protein
MSLDKFRKIEDNKGQFLPDNELEIYGKDPIKTSFGKWPNDTLRVIIYDGSNNPLPQKDWGLVRYINQEEFPQYYKKDDTVVSGTTKKYSVDIRRLIKDAGYNIGIFTVETMFINSRLGTEDKPNRVWIQEISPSRTEVRVLPFDLGDVKYKNTNILLSEIVAERYTAFLDDEEFKEDIWESIEPFLDLITVNDIRQLFINRVTDPLYQQILREYFNNDINVFNKVIFDVIHYFKLAVRHELNNLDSKIGFRYNQLNPNFGKPNTRDRVTVDFPQFCFDTLLVSLDCFVPVIVDFFETEIDDEIRTNEFTEIRPRVTIPTVQDPNPPTTTQPPNATSTTTDDPPLQFDRGQGKVKVRLWTNLPKNLKYDLDPVLKENTYKYWPNGNVDPNDKYLQYSTISFREYDTELNEFVLSDEAIQWFKDNPRPERGNTDTNLTSLPDQSWVDYSNRVSEWHKQELKLTTKEFAWTDCKVTFGIQRPTNPIEPFDGYYDCYRNDPYIFPTGNNAPNYKHTLPVYYLKNNNGPEKNIEVFKGNAVHLSFVGGFDKPASTSFNRLVNDSSWTIVQYIQSKLQHYKYVDRMRVIPGQSGLLITGNITPSNRQFYVRGMAQGQAPDIRYESEAWIVDYILNRKTKEKYYPDEYGNIPMIRVTEDVDLLIKHTRVKMLHVGENYNRTFPNCNEPALAARIGNQPAPGVGIMALPNFEIDSQYRFVRNFENDFQAKLFGETPTGRYYAEKWPKYITNAYHTPITQNTAFEYVFVRWEEYEKISRYTSVTDPETPLPSFYAPMIEQPQWLIDELKDADWRERDFI